MNSMQKCKNAKRNHKMNYMMSFFSGFNTKSFNYKHIYNRRIVCTLIYSSILNCTHSNNAYKKSAFYSPLWNNANDGNCSCVCFTQIFQYLCFTQTIVVLLRRVSSLNAVRKMTKCMDESENTVSFSLWWLFNFQFYSTKKYLFSFFSLFTYSPRPFKYCVFSF